GDTFAPRLLVHRCQHSALYRHSGCVHRRRRAGGRRAHTQGVVQSGRPRSRAETHFPDTESVVARPANRAPRRMTPEGEGILPPVGAGANPSVRTWRADAALAGNTLIWGSTFVLVQSALKDISPILFLA